MSLASSIHSRLLQLVSLFIILTVVIFVILWSRVRDARDEQLGGEIL